jgi:RNA polymerase sigma-70 factor (ECF subfamily)
MQACFSLSVEELVRRCTSSSDLEAWEEFVRRLHGLIAKVVHRIAERMGDSSRQTIDDLIQETYLKLCADNCRILRNFDHRHEGAFLGFVQVMAANVTRDHFRSSYVRNRAAEPFDEGTAETIATVSDSRPIGAAALERDVLIREVAYHLDRCTSGPQQDRNRKVFWLYYRTGLSAREIAALPGVGLNTKGVESLILRLRREVRGRIAAGSASNQSKPTPPSEGILPAQSF